MNPELSLCDHLSGLTRGDAPPEIAHAFLWQDGAVDAIARCRACGSHALLRLLDWAPPAYTLRLYSLAALRAEDGTLFLRNLERGSCHVERAAAELDALVAAAGPCERIVALDLARERVVAAGTPPAGAACAPGPFPTRLPAERDAAWFAALGIEKRGGRGMPP